MGFTEPVTHMDTRGQDTHTLDQQTGFVSFLQIKYKDKEKEDLITVHEEEMTSLSSKRYSEP